MNWQERMKHETNCPSHQDFKCKTCGNLLTIESVPCDCVNADFSYKCICGRDETVAAIEGVIDAAKVVCVHMYKSNPCDMGTAAEILAGALDRMDALEAGK